MRASDFEATSKLIPRLSAEGYLMQMAIAQYPHSKDKYRQQLHKEIYQQAHPIDPDAAPMELADLAKMLATGGRA